MNKQELYEQAKKYREYLVSQAAGHQKISGAFPDGSKDKIHEEACEGSYTNALALFDYLVYTPLLEDINEWKNTI